MDSTQEGLEKLFQTFSFLGKTFFWTTAFLYYKLRLHVTNKFAKIKKQTNKEKFLPICDIKT